MFRIFFVALATIGLGMSFNANAQSLNLNEAVDSFIRSPLFGGDLDNDCIIDGIDRDPRNPDVDNNGFIDGHGWSVFRSYRNTMKPDVEQFFNEFAASIGLGFIQISSNDAHRVLTMAFTKGKKRLSHCGGNNPVRI